MTIYGLKDLEYYRLQVGDLVIFCVKDSHGKFVDLKYQVHSDFLMCIDGISDASPSDRHFNDEIFTILGLDPHEFCTKYYGYGAGDGIWPSYKDYDLEAATNVVKALYTLIDNINGEWLRVKGDLCTIKNDLCTNIIWNGKEFGYKDIKGEWKCIDVDGITSCSNPYQESLSDIPINKLKKISSQIKTIKEDNNSKLKRI